MMYDGGVDYDDDYLVDKLSIGGALVGAARPVWPRGGGGDTEGLAELAGGWGPAETPQTPRRLPQTPVWAQGWVRGERPRVATIGKAMIFN